MPWPQNAKEPGRKLVYLVKKRNYKSNIRDEIDSDQANNKYPLLI